MLTCSKCETFSDEMTTIIRCTNVGQVRTHVCLDCLSFFDLVDSDEGSETPEPYDLDEQDTP